ncbi:MAG: prepilin peptidase [Patescibacteria group bacterium]
MVIIFFILGLIFGSFINALIWRFFVNKSIFAKHSICPHCHQPLAFWDLVPILSFLALRARCRYCRQKISWQYPLVELVTAVVFVLVYRQWGLSYQTFFYSVISLFLIIIFIYDLKYYLILDRVVWPAIILSLIFNLIIGYSFWSLILGGIIVAGFFSLQFIISRGRWIGGGDIRLGFLIGVILGWPQVLIALILAYVTGAIVGVMLILSKNKSWSSAIPFGTFLTSSTFFCLFYGQAILNWYLWF